MRMILLGAAYAAAIAAGCGRQPDTTLQDKRHAGGNSITLSGANGSHDPGEAILVPGSDALSVRVQLKTLESRPMPAAVLNGACGSAGRRPLYALKPLAHGDSETQVKHASLSSLQDGKHAIAVYDPRDETKEVACGDLVPPTVLSK